MRVAAVAATIPIVRNPLRTPSWSWCGGGPPHPGPGDGPIRLEAKIYQDWRLTFKWLELTSEGIGCRHCMALPEQEKKRVNGKKLFLNGTWKQNPKYSFSSATFSTHSLSPTHLATMRKATGHNPLQRFFVNNSEGAPGTPTPAPASDIEETVAKDDQCDVADPCTPEKAANRATTRPATEKEFQPMAAQARTSYRQRWANTAGLAYLKVSQLGSYAHWKQDLDFNASRNDTYLHDHSSETSWDEFCQAIVGDIELSTFDAIRKSPVFGLAFDTKKRDLSICIHFLETRQKKFEFVSMPLAKVKVPGETTKDLTHGILTALKDRGIDIERLGAVGADGASVTGVMTASELEVAAAGPPAENVCKELSTKINASLLCQHCCGHKLELAAADSWKDISYLREVEKRLKSLHKFLDKSGKAQTQLQFWSAASGEKTVAELRFARSRWIRQLQPMKIVLGHYVSFFSFLFGQHESLGTGAKDEETKSTISWIFAFLATWRCRVTLAGCVDVLSTVAKYKAKLEPSDLHPDTVAQTIVDLKKALCDYIAKGQVVASAFKSGKLDGPSELEKLLGDMHRHNSDTLSISFDLVKNDRTVKIERNVKFERFAGSASCVFETIEGFSKKLVDNLEKRFPTLSAYKHFQRTQHSLPIAFPKKITQQAAY